MKTGKKTIIAGLTAVALFYLIACGSTSKVSDQNIVDTYKNDARTLHPEFRLVHVNDSVSVVYFKINESELLYERKTLSDSFAASVRIFCRVTLNYESPLTLDSTSTVLNLKSGTNAGQQYIAGTLPVKMSKGNHYLLTISTYDINSKRNETTYIDANKTDFSGAQNFITRNPINGHVFFSPVFDSNVQVAIQYMHPVTKLYVRIYKNKFPIATPPFASDEGSSPQLFPDTGFTIYPQNGVFLLSLAHKGLYHIVVDSTDLSGLTLFRFDESYPDISVAYQMVAPLRYISSNDEFQKLLDSKNPKPDVDNFWLTASGGSKDRARELIHNYYNRIQDANRYFTSYQEGWKTDRGMIYLIFGPPTSIFRSSDGETWTYGEDRNYMALSFTFIKLDNPFTNNDYALQRSANYRNLWYNAVDMWREGRLF